MAKRKCYVFTGYSDPYARIFIRLKEDQSVMSDDEFDDIIRSGDYGTFYGDYRDGTIALDIANAETLKKFEEDYGNRLDFKKGYKNVNQEDWIKSPYRACHVRGKGDKTCEINLKDPEWGMTNNEIKAQIKPGKYGIKDKPVIDGNIFSFFMDIDGYEEFKKAMKDKLNLVEALETLKDFFN